MKKLRILNILIISLSTTGCKNLEKISSISSTISTTLTNTEVTSVPTLTIQPGSEEINFINGKIQIYINNIAAEEINITKEMVTSYDLFNRKLTINSNSNGHFFTKEINFEGGIIVDSSEDLVKYLNLPNSIILLKNNIYSVAAGPKTTYIENKVALIGEVVENNNPIINITGSVSGQAAAIFHSNISILNIDFRTNNQYNALKFINTSDFNNIYMKNINLEIEKNNNYSKGLNFYNIESIVLENVNIQIQEKGSGVGLSLVGSNININNSFIGSGTWGSIGVMANHDELISSITIDEISILESHCYVEDYQQYQEDFFNIPTSGSNFILKYFNGELFFVTYHLVAINSFQDLPKTIEGQSINWYKDNEFQNIAFESDFATAEVLYFAINNPAFQSIFNGSLILK